MDGVHVAFTNILKICVAFRLAYYGDLVHMSRRILISPQIPSRLG